MTPIEELFEHNSMKRGGFLPSISVVGDVMVDEYYQVAANRLSPEFPIPVLLSKSDKPSVIKPGGAANVAYQLKNFNVHGYLFGFRDKKTNFWTDGVNHRCSDDLVKLIPRKIRFYHDQFPLCRWDIEDEFYGMKKNKLLSIQKGLLEEFLQINSKVVILSDYNKGFWATAQPELWMRNRISIVDPKKGPVTKWYGCDIFKLNDKEAQELSLGLTDWKKQADYFESELACKAVLITQGANGVVGKINGQYYEYTPVKKVDVASIIGAGDCFIATLAIALSYDMSIERAAAVAFEAGAVYVQNRYNKPITPHDLLSHENHSKAKSVKPEFLKDRDFTLAFANGCFDIVHDGHIGLLRYAKTCADKLVVALNSDGSIARLKGFNRPYNDLNSRVYLLSMLEFVDFIVTFDEDTPIDLIREIAPDVLVKGGDYTANDVVGADIVSDVRIFPLVEGKSTTLLAKKIAQGF